MALVMQTISEWFINVRKLSKSVMNSREASMCRVIWAQYIDKLKKTCKAD